MKTLSDSLEPLVETWEDPGDYPSNAGSGPLPSYNYLAGMEGELVLELTPDEYREHQETVGAESLDFWMREVVDYRLPSGILSAKWQIDKTEPGENVRLTLSVTEVEVEADPSWRDDDGPEYEPDYDYWRHHDPTSARPD